MSIKAVKVKREHRLFYGWLIVLISFLGNFMHDGLGYWTFGLFIIPMGDEFGWTRTMTTGAFTLWAAMSGFVSPLIGPLVDKHGPRVIMAVGAGIAGVAAIATSSINALWQFYIFFGVLVGVGVSCFGGLVLDTTIAKWFIKRRGRATAIAVMGYSASGVILVPALQWFMSDFGWRMSWTVLGLLTWVLIIPLSLLFMRRMPEDVGLLPDGEQAEPEKEVQAGQDAFEQVWTLREASRTAALWLVSGSLGLGMGVGTGVTIHLVPYLADQGFSPAIAASVMSVYAFCMFLGKPAWGVLTERFHVRYCVIACLLGQAIGIVILLNIVGAASVFLFAVIFGLTRSGNVVLNPLAWANYFGRTSLGTIRGVFMPIFTIFSVSGPLIAAYLYDTTKTYQVAFWVMLGAMLLGTFLMFWAKPPRKRAIY